MELLAQRLVDGLGSGCIYAALALAIVLVFRTSGVVNFAQGEMAMLSSYLVWFLVSWSLGIWVALVISAVAAFILGGVLERGLIKRLNLDDHLGTVIVMTGLYTLINSLALLFFGSDGRPLPSLFPDGTLGLGSVRMPYATMGALAGLLVVSTALFVLFRFTKVGLGLRAVAQNRASSALAGLPVGRLLATGWGLAAALGAVSGVLVTSLGLYLEPSLMLSVLVYAMAAATLGGFDSAVGAVVAGVLLGVVESVAVGYITFLGTEMKLGVAFVVMLLAMVVRPNGLFGTARVARA
ncbi:branched-chain amino acid ABC transporter permease [Micromonospora sp. MA102]|uniref:branched-chain amino acid ABC transporter permease n=1 Tax=Micromonospora sp. MA102 TaxID=2952755 RepID=UPI0021C6F029|nr:branched-chain amino acid ABC transporter permease [Micromonospora sp. MA102]